MLTVDISSAPFKKTKKMTALIEKAHQYLMVMGKTNKAPEQIDLAKKDYTKFTSRVYAALPKNLRDEKLQLVIRNIPVNQVTE